MSDWQCIMFFFRQNSTPSLPPVLGKTDSLSLHPVGSETGVGDSMDSLLTLESEKENAETASGRWSSVLSFLSLFPRFSSNWSLSYIPYCRTLLFTPKAKKKWVILFNNAIKIRHCRGPQDKKKSISIRYKAVRHDCDELKKHYLEQCVNGTHREGGEC